MKYEQLRIDEMTSPQAASAVQAALERVAGVRRVQVLLAERVARVEHDGSANLGALVQALRRAGYHSVAVLA